MATTLLMSIVAHALILLGIGFAASTADPKAPSPMLEIALANNPQDDVPDDYDFLASANQNGGGNTDEAVRPNKPQRSLSPGVTEGRDQLNAAPAPKPQPAPKKTRVINGGAEASSETQRSSRKRREAPAAELIDADRHVAAASEATTPSERLEAKFPDKRRINARTREHAAAGYMRRWIGKVERIGNLNYPAEARRRNLSGHPILEVTLNPAGGVNQVKILRPSRHPVLDQSARRIVELAGPFEPIPAEVLQGNDLLVITRTWEFKGRDGFRAN